MHKLVRSFARGLQVLEALNNRNYATPVDISAATGLSRAAVHRLLHTLVETGHVRWVAGSDFVCLTSHTQELASGFDLPARALELAQPLIDDLGRELLWPIDLHVLDGGSSVIRGTTSQVSPQSPFGVSVGSLLPILGSGGGRAFVASLDGPERQSLLEKSSRRWPYDARFIANPGAVDRLVADVRRRGYAYRNGGIEQRSSSIALPIVFGTRPVIAVSVNFYRSVISIEKAAAAFLPRLRILVATVEDSLSQTAGIRDGACAGPLEMANSFVEPFAK